MSDSGSCRAAARDHVFEDPHQFASRRGVPLAEVSSLKYKSIEHKQSAPGSHVIAERSGGPPYVRGELPNDFIADASCGRVGPRTVGVGRQGLVEAEK